MRGTERRLKTALPVLLSRTRESVPESLNGRRVADALVHFVFHLSLLRKAPVLSFPEVSGFLNSQHYNLFDFQQRYASMSDCGCSDRLSSIIGGPSRRQFLSRCGMGIGALGLASLLSEEFLPAGCTTGAVQATHFPAKQPSFTSSPRARLRKSTPGTQNPRSPNTTANRFRA